MHYLVVDGMLSGTGIKDAIEGGYLGLNELGLSAEFVNDMSLWLHSYENAHYLQFNDPEVVAALDSQGLLLCKRLREELPQSKVDYFSSASMQKLA